MSDDQTPPLPPREPRDGTRFARNPQQGTGAPRIGQRSPSPSSQLPTQRPSQQMQKDDRRTNPRSYEQAQLYMKAERERNEAMLRAALKRADDAVALVRQMELRAEQSQKLQRIEAQLARRNAVRARNQAIIYTSFFLMFPWLLAVFIFGAGMTFTTVGESFTGVARLAALVGTYLVLVQLLLVGRVPWLDRAFGHDRMTRIHKVNGHLALDLIIIHAVGVTVGRAIINHVSIPSMTWSIAKLGWCGPAMFGTAIMIMAVITSIRAAKQKVRHERWHFIHKMTYVGTAISFPHVLYGPDSIESPFAKALLTAMFAATFLVLFQCRVWAPFRRVFQHQLHVDRVVKETPSITSVYMAGKRLSELKAKPGQFCYWRFLDGKHWRSAHPYSLSAVATDTHLRITVKGLGDHSKAMANLALGTWVTFQGPYGLFTEDKRTKAKTLLLAGGIGITPIRALLEGMEFSKGDLAVIYRASSEADAALLEEVEELALNRGAELHVVLGPSNSYDPDCRPLSAKHLRQLVPDVANRDVFICAAPPMTQAVRGTLKTMGLANSQVHYEAF